MKVVYSEKHILHNSTYLFWEGEKIDPSEVPERIEKIVESVNNFLNGISNRD